MKYEKTQEDIRREQDDLRSSPIMRFLRNRDAFKFKVGDVLIKQTANRWLDSDDSKWKTDTHIVGTPKKYLYAFENELGIGYIRQFKTDGSGFVNTLV